MAQMLDIAEGVKAELPAEPGVPAGGAAAAAAAAPAGGQDMAEDSPMDESGAGGSANTGNSRKANEAALSTDAEMNADDTVSSDNSSLLSEDDYVELQPSNFSQFVVVFGSKRNARERARAKHSGTQWECESCAQINSILESVCSACGVMDLDLLELGDDDDMADLRREAEQEQKKEAEERARKERAARLAKQQKRSNLQEMQNNLEEMKRLLKQKEALKKKKSGDQSPQPVPLTPGKAGPMGASPPPGLTALSLNPAPAKPPAVPEGPELPPHLLAARRARESQSDATPPRDDGRQLSSGALVTNSPTRKDDDDRRDRRRRSDSQEGRRRDRDRDRDRERRRRTEDRDRDRDRREKSRRDDRRPSSIEGLKSLISSTVESDPTRISGSKRMLSPDPNRDKSRKTEVPPKGKLRMDMYGAEAGPSRREEDRRSRSRSPPTKRGRGSSKWTGSRDRWEDEVPMVTASGKKIFQTARSGGSESLLKREHEQEKLKRTASGSMQGPARPAGPDPAPTKRSFKEIWREKLTGMSIDAEELSPRHDVLQASRGIVHHIATGGETRPWVNPYTEGLINASASTIGRGQISAVLTPFFNAECTFSTAQDRPDSNKPSYVAFDFGAWEVLPYQYTIGHSWDYHTNYMRSWSLRASEDNYKWDTLSRHSNDESIKGGSEVATFKLMPQDSIKFYRYFMVRLEPKGNSRHTTQLVASCFELYGYVRHRPS